MSQKTSSTRSLIAAAFAVALMGIAPQAAFADGLQYGSTWTLNMQQSKFSDGVNTLVIERNGSPAANGYAAPSSGSRVLVISHGNVYLATPGGNSASYGMSGMNLEQIGANVHVVGYCGLICQSNPNSRIELSFTAVNGAPHDMGQSVVFNSR